MGRLLRSPEGHEGDPPDPSLVSGDPPADPPKEPVAGDPPKEPDPAPKEPTVEPLTVEKLAVPEGFELQPELSTKFLEILNGDMSPQDRANALLALHGETLTKASEASSEAWDELQTKWKDEVKADPEIGGPKLQTTVSNIGKLLSEFGTDDLKEVFTMTGAGNNIHMIRFLDKISNVLTEGNFFKAANPSSGADDPYANAKRMFPSASDSN